MSNIDVGTALEVKLEDHVVAQGVVTEISDGKVYIDIPATRVVMGLKTSLGEPPVQTPEVEHQFAGTVEPNGDDSSEAIEQANQTFTNVPPPNPEQTQPNAGTQPAQQITVSNESLRNQQLDSSALD